MIEVQLKGPFMLALVLGVVLLSVLGKIYLLGTSEEYDMLFYSADAALLSDAEYSLPPGVNMYMNYSAPEKFKYEFEPGTVTVYRDDKSEGKQFWFTEDGDYKFQYRKFESSPFSPLVFYRTGNAIGVEKKGSQPDLNMPFCKRVPAARLTNMQLDASPDAMRFRDYLAQYRTQLFAGGNDALLKIEISDDPALIAYTNPREDSAYLACSMIQQVLREHPGLSYRIVPVNNEYLPEDDPRQVLHTAVPSVVLVLPQNLVASLDVQRKVAKGVFDGVKAYGLA